MIVTCVQQSLMNFDRTKFQVKFNDFLKIILDILFLFQNITRCY